jgi:glycosyltransferase involved in cell wall biosynthesis
LNQTYQNWEVIFWDNQSSDNSAKIFKSYKDNRFKYFYAENHTNLFKAKNLAIEKSIGDFIAFLHTDDFWYKNKLNIQMDYFNNPEVGVVYSNLWILKKEGRKYIYINEKLPKGKIYRELIKNYTVGICTTIIRKKIYMKLEKKFDERFEIIGDYDFFIRLSKLCTFESIQEPLAFYRLHGGNLTTVKKEIEVKEYTRWLEENKSDFSLEDTENIKNIIDNKKFVNSKMNGNYKELMKMIFDSNAKIFNLKNFIIFFVPKIILRKLLWYHQEQK